MMKSLRERRIELSNGEVQEPDADTYLFCTYLAHHELESVVMFMIVLNIDEK